MRLDLARRDTFEKLAESMGEMIDCMFQKSYVGFRPSKGWEPPVDIYEHASCFVVCVELAGMCREEIDVQIMPKRLLIRGTRPKAGIPEADGPHRVHLMEIRHGPFERIINLPGNLDLESVQAQYREGYLWIRLLKQEA
jgi:HSP20 family protein